MKLPDARRLHILETAARVFATHGFADASINAILEQAGVSKGAAYYYFDDKEDLFLTVVQYFAHELVRLDDLDIASLTRATYWPTVLEFYCQPLRRARDRPWAFGVLRAADELQRVAPSPGPLGAFVAEVLDFARAVFAAVASSASFGRTSRTSCSWPGSMRSTTPTTAGSSNTGTSSTSTP